jgi:uncharacterized SAM-dependent methyltransferase
VVADYTRRFRLPIDPETFPRTLAFFPGSTIGNFAPGAATAFLAMLGKVTGPSGLLLLGADLRKAARVVEPAYDDAAGVTAAFNRNVLRHLNRALGTRFDPLAFRHRAPWLPEEGRIEMRLVSMRRQTVSIPARSGNGHPPTDSDGGAGECRIELARDEFIVTEHSYKHSPEELDRMTAAGGWRPIREWRDDLGWYSVRLLGRSGAAPVEEVEWNAAEPPRPSVRP